VRTSFLILTVAGAINVGIAGGPLDGKWSGSADGAAEATGACSEMRYSLSVTGNKIRGLAVRYDNGEDVAPTRFPILGAIAADGAVRLVIEHFATTEARLEDGRIVGFQQDRLCRYDFAWSHE
jgi:hypothetical protein